MPREPKRPERGKPLYQWALSMWEMAMKNRLKAGPGITLRESSTGTTIAVKRRRAPKKTLPFEVTLITRPPASEGGPPTYLVTVAPGRVNERLPSDTDALKTIEPANLRDPLNPPELTEFPIEAGQAVYVKVEIDEDGAISAPGGGDPVLITIAADDIATSHYQPKVDDETTAGAPGTLYYKLARVIPGDSPDELKLENILGGSHLDHWRELPSLQNTSDEATDQGLIAKKWDQTAAQYLLRVLSKELGKLTIRTDPDEIVVRGNKIDALINLWVGDTQITTDGFVKWSDGLVETGALVNGDEQPAVDPEALDLYLTEVRERLNDAQVRVREVGAVGRVYQVEGNGKNGSLVINGNTVATFTDGLWTSESTSINIETDLPSGNAGDMLYHDGTGWVILSNPGPIPGNAESWLLVHDGTAPSWEASDFIPSS